LEDGRVKDYSGTLDEYLYSCELRAGSSVASGAQAVIAAAVVPGAHKDRADDRARENPKDRRRREAAERNLRNSTIGPIKKRIESIQSRIDRIESAQSETSAALSDPETYQDRKKRDILLSEYQRRARKIDELTARWERAAEELEMAERQLNSPATP